MLIFTDNETVIKPLQDKGHAVICVSDDNPEARLKILARCDAIVQHNNTDEITYARKLGIPIHQGLPDLHITEQRCPEQCARFDEILGQLSRMHKKKNGDYGPGNILLTGLIGVVVRLSDKMARILNLSGFKLNLQLTERVDDREPENESIIDSIRDVAVYAIIWLIVKEGKWGK